MSQGPRGFVSNTADDAAGTRVVDPGLEASRKRADESLKLRYVAFDDEAGVFLGLKTTGGVLPIWSRLDPDGLNTAPTFSSRDEFTRHLQDAGLTLKTVNFRMVQVAADLDHNYASKTAISRALLPLW